MSLSKIEWTNSTWNPLTGCSKVSDGCKNCYAEKMSNRLLSMGSQNYTNGFDLSMHESALEKPLKWKKSRIVFVNSMSDLFHEEVPFDFIKKIFDVMNKANQHIYQVLTKRPENMLKYNSILPWSNNIWMGVTVESSKYVERIDLLKYSGAAHKFISFEPLLDDVGDVNLAGIDWAIVGGESGAKAREMEPDWALRIRDKCIDNSIPFFFKQWGGVNKKKAGKLLDGKIWEQVPNYEI